VARGEEFFTAILQLSAAPSQTFYMGLIVKETINIHLRIIRPGEAVELRFKRRCQESETLQYEVRRQRRLGRKLLVRLRMLRRSYGLVSLQVSQQHTIDRR
jgi:hypothetical protein